MFFASTATGPRVAAAPGAAGECPACRKPVKPKCGELVAWHWAHEAQHDCDPWAEPDSAWHSAWQSAVPPERREVVMGPHRADAVAANGWVVELQHSTISPAEIIEREKFYGRMVWLFDAVEAADEGRLTVRNRQGERGPYVTFRWKHPRKTVTVCDRPLLLDLGLAVLWVRRIWPSPCAGWGQVATSGEIQDWMRDGTCLNWGTL